jgi:predicted nucleic acid-binding protein
VILVDTSVWVDHFRETDATLAGLLNSGKILMHPFVVGEIALESLRQRDLVLGELQSLPAIVVALHQEVLHLIEQHRLSGIGIGYVDAHLLSAVQLTPGASLWTRDKRLYAVADRLGLAATLVDKPNGAEPRRIQLPAG